MLAAARTPGRDRIAIGGSIAIHALVVVAVLALLPKVSFQTEDPDERTLFVSLLRVEHRPPAAPVVRPKAAPAPAAVPQEAVPVVKAAVSVAHAARRLVVAREDRALSVSEQLAALHRDRPAMRTVTAARIVATAPPSAAPAAAVSGGAVVAQASVPSAAPSPAAAQREDGIGNFSESYPAAIDPSLRAALFSGMNGIVVRITVDENGRPTGVEFVRSPGDASQREELRARILATRFTPASCNGLRCAGTVELRN